MDCNRARESISARMDGERLSERALRALDDHTDGCSSCSGYAAAAWRIRESVRFEVAAPVPDLVAPIMTKVRAEPSIGAPARPIGRARRRARGWGPDRSRAGWRALVPVVAALLVGMVAGSVLVGGPRSAPAPIAAADITRGVASTAREIHGYSARFAMTEWHFLPQVPSRRFTLDVSFAAPARFAMRVVDHTNYPPGSWTPNDLSLVVNGSRSFESGPAACPRSGPLTCPDVDAPTADRSPFQTSPQLPSDLVLPIGTLADPSAVTVLGRGRVAGRSAYQVELPFARAVALFPFLQAGGSWRPFFPGDRVVLWIDARSYFPLEYRVFPSPDPARRAWERQNGLPKEPPHFPVFQSTVLEMNTAAPPASTFRIPVAPGQARPASSGTAPVSLARVRALTGYEPKTPGDLADLHLYGATVSPTIGGRAPQIQIAYANGLAWLTVQETTGWTGNGPFGGVGPQSAQVRLADGVGYYEPATEDAGRRLAIHGSAYDLILETDLPRAQLIAIAGSISVRGQPFPSEWLVSRSPGAETARLPLDRAVASQPFSVGLPTALPPGYSFASAQLVRVASDTGLNVYFQQRESELGAGPILLHEDASRGLPPASAASQSSVRVGSTTGRWTPARGELEWVRGGVYHEVEAPGLQLSDLLAIATSLRTDSGRAP